MKSTLAKTLVPFLLMGIHFLNLSSHAAQVDLGITLGSVRGDSGVLSGTAVRLGYFTGYSDSLGMTFFTNKDYSTLNTAFTALSKFGESATVDFLGTDGTIYSSFDTGSAAAGTRLFAWFYDSVTLSDAAKWVILSGGGGPGPLGNLVGGKYPAPWDFQREAGVVKLDENGDPIPFVPIDNSGVFNPNWLAVAPTAIDANTIEVATLYTQIYASNIDSKLINTTIFDPEGAIIVIPEPSSAALSLVALSFLLVNRRRKATLTRGNLS